MMLKKLVAPVLTALAVAFIIGTPVYAALTSSDSTLITNIIRDVIGRTTGNVTVHSHLDQIDTKLNRVLASCGAGTGSTPATPTRTGTVSLAQANTCVSACISGSTRTTSYNNQPLYLIDRRTFVSCISHCPSNTQQNEECAQRYLGDLDDSGGLREGGERGVLTPQSFADYCLPQFRNLCTQYTQAVAATLGSCLVDQSAFACQARCDANFTTYEAATTCYSTCNGSSNRVDNLHALQRSGILDANGRMTTFANGTTSIAPGTLVPTAPAPGSTAAISACLNSCNNANLNCIKSAATGAALSACAPQLNSCRNACGGGK